MNDFFPATAGGDVTFSCRQVIGFSFEKPEGPCRLTLPLSAPTAKVTKKNRLAGTCPRGKWHSGQLALLARTERGHIILRFVLGLEIACRCG